MRFKVERHVFDNFVGFYMVDTEEDARRLMDEMWNAGFRPSEGSGSAGALKAVQDHLADMQKIVFKFIK